jgi:hypothetical protein
MSGHGCYTPEDVDVLIFALGMGGYEGVREIDGVLYGLQKEIYTTGLFCDLTPVSYLHRYCYEHHADARKALRAWDGQGHPPGPWIKRKGLDGELLNPEWSKAP